MLAYAIDRRPPGRTASPRLLVLILAGHAAAIAAIMASRMDLPPIVRRDPTVVDFIPETPPPPPEPREQVEPRRSPSHVDRPTSVLSLPSSDQAPLDHGPSLPDPGPMVGPDTMPTPDPLPTPVIVRRAARFVTPAEDVRPPYPESKRRLQQEASLRLALEIDARGRVTSVTAVGPADAEFLEAARRHILKRWRYRPASEDGSAVASRTVVTLRFELDD
jgi:periplasmic protein TonB